MRSKFMASFLLISSFIVPAQAATYTVDQDHSSVEFKIKHLFSNVKGTFKKFEGTVDYEPGKSEAWKTSGSIDASNGAAGNLPTVKWSTRFLRSNSRFATTPTADA